MEQIKAGEEARKAKKEAEAAEAERLAQEQEEGRRAEGKRLVERPRGGDGDHLQAALPDARRI